MAYGNQLPDHHRYIDQIPVTPLVAVRLTEEAPLIWCKLEFLNPSGSTKDRIARYMLEKAWRQGILKTDGIVMEASSGSTSIALALACAQMGLKFIAVMPENVSSERVLIIKEYGGEVILSPKEKGLPGCIARSIVEAEKRGAYLTRQFENPDNAESHYLWTGQEILAQIPGGVVHGLVSGVGTGGTIVGLHRAFTEAGCEVIPYVARPTDPAVIGGVECSSFSTRIPGVLDSMSKIFIKENMRGLIELDISANLALQTARQLIRLGFPVGPSSGLNYAAALVAAEKMGSGAQIVTVFPDRMERYFSTELFAF